MEPTDLPSPVKDGSRVRTRDLYFNDRMSDALTTVLDLEREMQRPGTRADPHRLGQLLSPDFEEVGASGRSWDRSSILAMLAHESMDPDTPVIEIHDLRGRAIAPGVIQVSWRSHQGERQARRTSLWREDEDGWQLVHHQGTLLPPPAEG